MEQDHGRRQTEAGKKEIMDAVVVAINAAVEHHQLSCPIRDIVPQVTLNTKGVNNFNTFRLDMTRKIGFVHGAVWIAGVVSLLALAVFGWSLTVIVPAARLVIDDYYVRHPAAKVQQQKSVSTPPEKIYAVRMDRSKEFAKE